MALQHSSTEVAFVGSREPHVLLFLALYCTEARHRRWCPSFTLHHQHPHIPQSESATPPVTQKKRNWWEHETNNQQTAKSSFGAACELLESGAAIIIVKKYKHDLRETLQMAGAEAV